MSIIKSVKGMYNFSKYMKYYLIIILLDGIIIGFISASSTHLIPDSDNTSINAGIFLMFLGLGAIIGGFISGIFSD